MNAAVEFQPEFPKPNPDAHPFALPGIIVRACGHISYSFYIDQIQPRCLTCGTARSFEKVARRN